MIKLLSLFSGIGAFEKALDREGIDYSLVNYCEIDSQASKAYAAVHGVSEELNLHDVTTVTGVANKDIDLVTYGFPCFTGDTLIATRDGYKEIKDVRDGDYVLTHANEYRMVERFIPQGAREIWHINAMCTHGIDTTANHRFYVRQMYRYGHDSKRAFKDPVWVDCSKLDKSYYLGVPVNCNSVMYSNTAINLDFSDATLWYLAGRYLGDGWLSYRDNRKTELSGVVICCGKHKAADFEKHIGTRYHYTKIEERTVYKYIFSSVAMAKMFSLMGHGAGGKELPQRFIDMPITYVENIIDGYLDSNGGNAGVSYRISTVSKKLVYSAASAIAKVYHRPVAIYHNERPATCVIKGRTVNQRAVYQLVFKKTTDKHDKAFFDNGYIWYPIRSVVNTHTYKEVFDISVDTHHSFVANNCIAHNCQDISQAGHQKGLVGSDGNITRSGLFFEALRIIMEGKPKIAVAENVKALTSKKFTKEFSTVLSGLDLAGYNNYYQVLNAKDYGIPQNRERVFIVSIRKDVDDGSFKFPNPVRLTTRLKDILEDNVDEKFYLSEEQIARIKDSTYFQNKRRIQDKDWCDTLCARDWKDPKCVKVGNVNPSGYGQNGDVVSSDGIARTVTIEKGEGKKVLIEPKLQQIDGNLYPTSGNPQAGRVYDAAGISPSLDTCQGGNRMPKIVEPKLTQDFRIRKLTPLECWRLMGFDDEDFFKAKNAGMSNTQLYKQAGNSVVVQVLQHIFRNLYKR